MNSRQPLSTRNGRAVLPFVRRLRSSDDGGDGTPAGVLRRLLDGNRRFARGLARPALRDGGRGEQVGPSRAPIAAVIGCSDAPVPNEVLFDCSFGDLFVLQNAGNVVTPDEVASLEYAAVALQVRAILVLGHTRCGAVATALTRRPVEGTMRILFQHIASGHDPARRDPMRVVEDNARSQHRRLLDGSPILKDRVASGRLMVAAAVHDIAAATVRVVT